MIAMDGWTRRYAFHLLSIPELIAVTRSQIAPLKAARYDATRVDGGGSEGHVPFTVGAMDDADLLWALLIIYAREVAYLVGGAAPTAVTEASWETAGDVAGIRAQRTTGIASAQARQVVQWLITRAPEVARHAELEATEDQLFSLVRQLRVRYGIEERAGSNARRCATCGERKVVAVYATVAGMEAELVQCTACGASGKEAVYGDTEDADVLASGEEGEAASRDDQEMATSGDAHGGG